MKTLRGICSQFARYLSVGLLSNGLAYAMYVVIVLLGGHPVVSMTIVYILASSIAFQANKVWTFHSLVRFDRALLRYVFVQALGYVTNLLLLAGLHYGCGIPHYTSQLLGMAIVAVELFLISRYYVFA
jgi:putative flippase GtrA